MQIPKTISSYFLAENFPQERRWGVGMARVFTWCAIGGFISQGSAAAIILHRYDLTIFAVCAISMMFVAIKLNDSGKTKPARILRMIVALAFFTLIVAKTGGLTSPSFFWASVFILGSMFSFGAASAVPTALALALMATYFYVQTGESFIYFQYIVSLAFIYALSYLFDQLSKYFIKLAETQREKAIQAKALAEASQKNTASILESIHEGILSILPEGIIDDIHSPYFAKIIESSHYTGRNLKEVLFDRLQVSSDRKDQCWQALLSALGESIYNFEVNAELLIYDAELPIGPRTKYLKLKWSPIVDDNDTIVKVTLAVEDVTEHKQKEAELAQRRTELAVIGQLIDVSEEKCRAFFLSAQRLLTENKGFLNKNNLTHGDIRILFVNAHTVKGAARTLGFNELTPMVHDAEETYQKILKAGHDIDLELMRSQHVAVESMFQFYETINFDKLKRRRESNNSSLAIERSFIEKHYQILFDAIASIDQKNWSMDELMTVIQTQNRELAKHIFELLPSVLDAYDDLTTRVAQSLQKPKPKITSDAPDVIVYTDMKYLLDNCMTHIIRNALDHGIESAEVRTRKGKSPEGHIWIKAKEEQGFLKLTISDDGQGLAIEKLRERAPQHNIAPNAPIQDIAELIFKSGLSTAEQVSDISGRGVGMDAVRRYLEEIGGSVNLELLGQSEPGYQKFQLQIAIPSQYGAESKEQPGQSTLRATA